MVTAANSYSPKDLFQYAEMLVKESKLREASMQHSANNYSWLSSKRIQTEVLKTNKELDRLKPLIQKLSSENCAKIAVKLDNMTDEDESMSSTTILSILKKLLDDQTSIQLMDKNVMKAKERGVKRRRVNKVHPVLLPDDRIVPTNHQNIQKVYLIPEICQTTENLPELKLQILPRSRISINDTSRVRSEISSKKIRNKKSKCNIFKGKADKKKYDETGCHTTKSTTKYKKKSNGSLRSNETSIKSKKKCQDNKWKRMMKKSHPSNMKWIKNDIKPRENLTSSCTDNEESAGDGPPTPKLSRNIKKRPLRWNLVQEQNYSDTYVDYIKKDGEKRVTAV